MFLAIGPKRDCSAAYHPLNCFRAGLFPPHADKNLTEDAIRVSPSRGPGE